MGTSSSHRSPRTPAWDRVQRLYADPEAPPEAIVSGIVDALTPTTREQMADAAVARCMGTLTGASTGAIDAAQLSVSPALPASWDLAAALRSTAERSIIDAREASRFGEIALDALSASALEVGQGADDTSEAVRAALARYAAERRLSELAGTFLAQDVSYAFRYFVERDLPAHVGGGRLGTVADAARLTSDISAICEGTTRGLELGGLEDDLWRAADAGPASTSQYRGVLKTALGESLRALGGIA
ncbi:MAG TPA: hypothetical protein QGH10_17200 [Armatimonadota bacterium]|nr:hypothetical protein [Armatimonadota bacterium]